MHARTAVVEIVLLLALTARSTQLSAQSLAAGPEVQVNTEPVAESWGLAVDAVEDGSFRLVWASVGSGLSTRLLDRMGQPTRSGGVLDVSGDSISMDTDGGDDRFVVVWGQGYDGHAQWFDHNGAAEESAAISPSDAEGQVTTSRRRREEASSWSTRRTTAVASTSRASAPAIEISGSPISTRRGSERPRCC